MNILTDAFAKDPALIGAIHNANNIVDTDKEKADDFNSYFSSVGIADNGKLPFITNNHNHKNMEDIIKTK